MNICTVSLENRVLLDMHRAAAVAGRRGIAVPSRDLAGADRESGRKRTTQAISRLVRTGRVLPVRKDLLVLPDSTGIVTVGLPELVKAIAPTPHLITGGRALEENGLTNQHFFKIVVLVPSPVTPFSFRGETARFLQTDPKRIWGWQRHGPRFADPERVLVDAVSHPRYGVSLTMALGALEYAAERNPEFLKRLAAAARRYNSAAAARRLGLVVERLFGEEAADPFTDLIGDSRTPVLLRATGVKEGPVDRKWRVIVNASTEPARMNA